MKVGVVIPAYNCGRFIDEAIASVLGQTHADLALVVVDDGSTDDTGARARSWQERDERVRVVSQSNAGASAARLTGLDELGADADALLFLDADDVLEPSLLATLGTHLERHPSAGMAFCKLRLIGEQGEELPAPDWWTPRLEPSRIGLKAIPDERPFTPFFSILAGAAVIPSVSLLRRSTYAATSGWDPTFGQPYEDMNLFLEMALEGEVHHVPATLVRHRRRSGQSTDDAARTHAQEQRLHDRWRTIELPATKRALVDRAWAAYDRRYVPRQGIASALRLAREGRPFRAARFASGALRRSLVRARR